MACIIIGITKNAIDTERKYVCNTKRENPSTWPRVDGRIINLSKNGRKHCFAFIIKPFFAVFYSFLLRVSTCLDGFYSREAEINITIENVREVNKNRFQNKYTPKTKIRTFLFIYFIFKFAHTLLLKEQFVGVFAPS